MYPQAQHSDPEHNPEVQAVPRPRVRCLGRPYLQTQSAKFENTKCQDYFSLELEGELAGLLYVRLLSVSCSIAPFSVSSQRRSVGVHHKPHRDTVTPHSILGPGNLSWYTGTTHAVYIVRIKTRARDGSSAACAGVHNLQQQTRDPMRLRFDNVFSQTVYIGAKSPCW